MAEKDNSGFGWRGIAGSTLVGIGAADLRHSKWRGKAMILTGAAMLLTPKKANAAEPGKPAAPAKTPERNPVHELGGMIVSGLGGAMMLIGGSKVRDRLNFDGLPASRLQRTGNVVKGGALITAGAALVGLGLPFATGRTPSPSKPDAPAPSGPAGPIGATGNAPGGPAPAQDTGPGLLTKAAVHLASALPQTAPLVQAAKDPETAVRLGVGALGTATTVQAARMLSPAARVGAKFLTKAMLPLTVALAAKDGIEGYQKDGVKGAAIGVVDSLTGGLLNLGLEKAGIVQAPGTGTPPMAPTAPQAVVSDRLDVARAAANRTAGEIVRTETLNTGSTAPAAAEIKSDGMTDEYFRQQNGRQVRVSGYQTPGR